MRVAAVSYTNTKPFIYGIEHSGLVPEVELVLDTPSSCAELLKKGEVDIGLVPVASILDHSYHIVSDFCIGCNGAVNSVIVISEVPINQVETIVLDYQSRTSVELTKILAAQLWEISPTWEQGSEGYETTIKHAKAGLVIGDRALQLKGDYKYCYDLGTEWKNLTSLPFVFACWASNKSLSDEFSERFSKALEFGVDNIEKVIEQVHSKLKDESLAYLTNYISYSLDSPKKKGMELFLDIVRKQTKTEHVR